MARRAPSASRGANLTQTGGVRLAGLDEYQRKLSALGEGMVTRGCVMALAPGANLLRDAARARAPILQMPDPRRKPGTVRDAIAAVRVKAQRYAVQFVIGIRLLKGRAISAFKRRSGKQAKDNPDDPFYGPILEFGKTERTRHPFLRPGFQAGAEPAVRLAAQKLGEFTDAEIRRLGAQ